MRLIDADALDECKELMTDIKGETVYVVRMSDVRSIPTVCDIEQIRDKIEKVFCMSVVTNELRTPMEVKADILQIIDKYKEQTE